MTCIQTGLIIRFEAQAAMKCWRYCRGARARSRKPSASFLTTLRGQYRISCLLYDVVLFRSLGGMQFRSFRKSVSLHILFACQV